MTGTTIRIGTRASPMALAQARFVMARLSALDGPAPGTVLELVPLMTTGDRILDRPLADVGGKGLFVKELQRALLDGSIDLAVHSLKDVESNTVEGLGLAAILPRDDPRDAFLSRDGRRLMDLPAGARVGTSSPRRLAFLRRLRPDLELVPMRGNVNSRLAKLDAGVCDGLVLALSGLTRLGFEQRVTEILEVERMLPAAGQGALAVECRTSDAAVTALVARLACARTTLMVRAERAVLAAVSGNCHTPLAAYADIGEDGLPRLRATLFDPAGASAWSVEGSSSREELERLGQRLGSELRAVAERAHANLG
ncbi:hydroxymethylbilane synthase [Bosea sp. (in: a-proteobacteria)]|uniref:hydroxymethylbilane synthase n=1 Tax=Bosea sp. (in: a-proteobacteria) TaxID=1871050 RepID=UPI0026151650|nr:hydroxymethylbilane synthase [Bosea sp. (in: a-proteobacteria)]MCO5089488.1 hydroxymethylbilane synthase [Bosea sp. (in: a-proteobacteria)]